jgi:threonine dehydrogenase-like Zn-dependent dehydrogenase
MNKGLTIKTGQTHVQAYTKPLLQLIEAGDTSIQASSLRIRRASKTRRRCTRSFATKEDGFIKVVLRPGR